MLNGYLHEVVMTSEMRRRDEIKARSKTDNNTQI
jgi:hypothetical protein